MTSPEISQVFGELIGVWAALQYEALGSPDTLRIVEFGPGRGTLMADLLRGTRKFAKFRDAVSVHLIEVSPALRKTQAKTLRCGGVRNDGGGGEREIRRPQERVRGREPTPPVTPVDRRATLRWARRTRAGKSEINGAEVFLARRFGRACRDGPTLVICHEFFDAFTGATVPTHRKRMVREAHHDR